MFYSYAVHGRQNIIFTSRLEQICYNLTNAQLLITYHHFQYQSQGTTIRQEWHCCESFHCTKRGKMNILVTNLREISINICLYQTDNYILHFKLIFYACIKL